MSYFTYILASVYDRKTPARRFVINHDILESPIIPQSLGGFHILQGRGFRVICHTATHDSVLIATLVSDLITTPYLPTEVNCIYQSLPIG